MPSILVRVESDLLVSGRCPRCDALVWRMAVGVVSVVVEDDRPAPSLDGDRLGEPAFRVHGCKPRFLRPSTWRSAAAKGGLT